MSDGTVVARWPSPLGVALAYAAWIAALPVLARLVDPAARQPGAGR